MSPAETVIEFMNRINQRDADKLSELMTGDHTLIDALGQTVSGRDSVRAAFQAYYGLCPDYWVTHEGCFEDRNLVAVFGTAGGTIAVNGELRPENKWRTPAAWLAVVENGLVKEWRVYADNKPVYEILAKAAPA